jgi:hypothetical protein
MAEVMSKLEPDSEEDESREQSRVIKGHKRNQQQSRIDESSEHYSYSKNDQSNNHESPEKSGH